MYGVHTLVTLFLCGTLATCVTAFVPGAGSLVLNPFSSTRAVGKLRAGGGLCRRSFRLTPLHMSSPVDKSDAESKKAVEAWQVVLASARKRKEEIKHDFFQFSQFKYGEIAECRVGVFNAKHQYSALKWVPALGDLLENRLEGKRKELEGYERDLDKKRIESKALLSMAEKEIREAEEQLDLAYQRMSAPTSMNQVGFHDPKLRSDAEAMLLKAEKAYRQGKRDASVKALEEAQPIFETLAIFPDSKAANTSLSGRLYDLKKCIDTGAEYRTGASTGTEYITANKRIPSDVAAALQTQWSSQKPGGRIEQVNEWLDKPRLDPQFDAILTSLALVSTLGLLIFALTAGSGGGPP
mmetsp:Transcript_27359/g.63552  ORF Transcript_27359/g.63552 Transcript_27359/m.63552 type:complete len:353 (+) Transcript_27359:48-1106(+)